MAQIAALNFAPLELRTMAHELDELLSKAEQIGVTRERAEQILREEVETFSSSTRNVGAFELAWKRIIEEAHKT